MNYSIATWLQNLDWDRNIGLKSLVHSEVFCPGRHKFYSQILQDNVRDRSCVEAGFGTGILTLLALQHGATKVESWEMDPHVYKLGNFVIEQLGLEHQINLVPGKFTGKAIDRSRQIFYHEIMSPNIWNEGLRDACPLDYDLILPGTISVFFEKIILPRQTFQSIWLPERRFDPGILVYPGFTDVIQNLLDHSPSKAVKRSDLEQIGLNLDFYEIDFNAKTVNGQKFNHIPEHHSQIYHIDIMQDEVVCFYPWSRLSHGSHSMFWSWSDPLFFYCTGSYEVTQSFVDGFYDVYRLQ
jgi:hypothetical protein